MSYRERLPCFLGFGLGKGRRVPFLQGNLDPQKVQRLPPVTVSCQNGLFHLQRLFRGNLLPDSPRHAACRRLVNRVTIPVRRKAFARS